MDITSAKSKLLAVAFSVGIIISIPLSSSTYANDATTNQNQQAHTGAQKAVKNHTQASGWGRRYRGGGWGWHGGYRRGYGSGGWHGGGWRHGYTRNYTQTPAASSHTQKSTGGNQSHDNATHTAK